MRKKKKKPARRNRGRQQQRPKTTTKTATPASVQPPAALSPGIVNQPEAPGGNDPPNKQATSENGTLPFLVWERRFTAALVVFTFFQVVISQCQLSSMKATVEEMRTDRRAWLTSSGVTFKDFVEGEQLHARIGLDNLGSTPAKTGAITVATYVEPPSVSAKSLGTQFNLIPPTQPNGVGHIVSGKPNSLFMSGLVTFNDSDARIVDIIEKRRILYIFVKVLYEDGIGRDRTTAFCYQYDPDENEFRINGEYVEMD